MSRLTKKAASLSVISNTLLVVLKLFAGTVSGSISIISEAIHSASDLLASFLALFSVSRSSQPADSDHPFGHGKYEDFSGLIEGGLIIFAAVYIIGEAVEKLMHYNSVKPIDTAIGITVMFVAVICNSFLSFYLSKVAQKTDSMALYADAEHIKTDVWSSLAVLGGLIAIKITSLNFIDSVMAFIVAVIIAHAGMVVCKKSLNNLLDGSLPKEDLELINKVLSLHSGNDIVRCISLQTRKSGPLRTINLKLSVNESITIKEGHKICDKIENEIKAVFSNVDVVIHLEPENSDVSNKLA